MKKGSIKNKFNIKGVNFYWGNTCINDLWFNHLSNLSMEQESRCLELFISRYKRRLKKIK